MANRCPDCNKFVGLEQEEPEVNGLDIDQDGNITGEVRLPLVCVECGTEMKETTLDFTVDASPEILAHVDAHITGGQDYTLTVEEDGVETNDWYETKDRHGKPIKNPRYQRHFYGFNLTVAASCSCGKEFDKIEIAGEEQASAFDEIY